jgi:hypothetical protein
MNRKGLDTCDVTGISAYGTYFILKQLEVFARVDLLSSVNDWNLAADGKGIVAGVQYSPVKNVKVAADFQGALPADPAATSAAKKRYAFLNMEFSF